MTLPLGMAGDAAIGAGRLWVIVGPHGPDVQGENRVAVLDFRTSQIDTLPLGESATAIAYGEDTVWIGTYGGGGGEPDDTRLEAIRAGHSKVLHTVLEKHGADWGPLSIAVGDRAVWVVTYSTRQLFKINPITLQIEHRLDLSAEQPGSVTVGAGGVWLTGAHSVIKIDPRTDTVVHTYPINTGYTCAVAATSTTLWLAVDGRGC
jgi:hypothetical protein